MTNTSKIGADYERAWRARMQSAGFHCTRSAASKGLFDVIAYSPSGCHHAQLKAGRMSCQAARAYALTLVGSLQATCTALVVHRARTMEFCTHVG